MCGGVVETCHRKGTHAVLSAAVDDVVVLVLCEREDQVVLCHTRNGCRAHPEIPIVGTVARLVDGRGFWEFHHIAEIACHTTNNTRTTHTPLEIKGGDRKHKTRKDALVAIVDVMALEKRMGRSSIVYVTTSVENYTD